MGKKSRNSNKTKDGLGGGGKDRDKDKATAAAHSRSNEDSDGASDDESETSHLSLDDDMTSIAGDHADAELTEQSESAVEDQLNKWMDSATNKSLGPRTKGLEELRKLLCKAVVPELVEKYRMTLVDTVEKALKRGQPDATLAAHIVPLISLQLGQDASDIMTAAGGLADVLRISCDDPTQSPNYRALCATVLSVCGYCSVDEVDVLNKQLAALKSAWSGVKTGNSTPEQSVMFCSAITAWGLLLTQVTGRRVEEALTSDLPKLCAYFDSNQVDIRIAAGETLALLYELGAGLYNDQNYHPPNHQKSLATLEGLSLDSLKYRAKKDRRIQRSTFRQIYAAIKDKQTPDLTIKFGTELLVLDSWSTKFIYDAVCSCLRGGTLTHLMRNTFLRHIFDLGPLQSGITTRMTKQDRVSIQNEITKARQQNRGKQRGKRVAVFGE